VAVVPRDTTIAVVEAEFGPLAACAARRGWAVSWDPTTLSVLADGPHPAPGVSAHIHLHADVKGYRGLPPTWTFQLPPARDAEEKSRRAEEKVKAPFPKGAAVPHVGSSIFHPHGIICAPFNLLAYHPHGGPHTDWNAATWLDVRGNVRATTLAEMLAQILLHLASCPEWL
jgi:hypothetical protein